MRPTEKLNPDNPMNRTYRLGLGDAVKVVIHAGLNITPMPAPVRAAIQGGSGCRRRQAYLNKLAPNLNPFSR